MELERFVWKGDRRVKTKNKKKYLFAIATILLIAITICLFVDYSQYHLIGSSEKIQLDDSELEITIKPAKKIDNNKFIMTIGEESTIYFSFITDTDENIDSEIIIPEGLQHISGNNKHVGIAKEGIKLKAYIRAVKVGRWRVEGIIISGNESKEEFFDVCIDVLEDKARERCIE